QPPLVLDEHFNIDGFQLIESGTYLFMHAREADEERVIELQQAINELWDCGQAFRPGDSPPGWQVGNNPRFPDLMLVPDAGCAVASTRGSLKSLTRGDHGWAPDEPDMHGIFIAAGPGIPAGLRIPALRSVDVYPLMLRQLGLPVPTDPDSGLDSDLDLWPGVLRAGQE
ncbi:MAG TPA: hypothetical protein VFG52_10295, partial [Xanthomonadales bacterium]|nr:hypothetical protein [Xanthomonadales bacterium]